MGRNLPVRILFITPYAPTVVRPRPLKFVSELAALGHQVTLASIWTSNEELNSVRDLAPQLERTILERHRSYRSLANCLLALPTSRPLQACYSWNRQFLNKISAELTQHEYDIVHVEHLRGVRYGIAIDQLLYNRASPRRPIVVWDSVDCISLLFSQAAEKTVSLPARWIAKFELPRTRRYEGQMASRFRRIVMTAESDRGALLDLVSLRDPLKSADFARSVSVVPNGVDLNYFSQGIPFDCEDTIVFTGKMSYHANVTAAVALVRRIMPLVWQKFPKARLMLVGKDPTSLVRQLPAEDPLAKSGQSRVVVTGTVPDVRPYLRQASVAVAPLAYAVGIQNKVLEAMASGLPVVVSPVAAAGLDAVDGRHLCIAQSVAETAQAINLLLADAERRRTLGAAARAFVEKSYTWNAATKRLCSVYEDALAA